jgi:hypothetical protein
MSEEATRLIAITRARDRLRKAAFKGGQELLPTRIAFSMEWMHEFLSLKDRELFCPVAGRIDGSTFWGVPISIEPLGAHAIVTYANGSCASVQLEIQ